MNNHSTWNLYEYDLAHPEAKHGPDIHYLAAVGVAVTEGNELGEDQ